MMVKSVPYKNSHHFLVYYYFFTVYPVWLQKSPTNYFLLGEIKKPPMIVQCIPLMLLLFKPDVIFVTADLVFLAFKSVL